MLKNLNSVFKEVQHECLAITIADQPNITEDFKSNYSKKILEDVGFSRHNRIAWDDKGTAELWSRNNDTRIYLPSISFLLALKLVPLYVELVAYREKLVEILSEHGRNLQDTEEAACVPYINSYSNISDDERSWLIKFVTEGSWWGKGRAIKRVQDFFESPLMQCAKLTQETQSEIARITKQLYDNPDLMGELEDAYSQPPLSVIQMDRLSSALKLFRRGRAEKGLDGWASFDAWAKEARTQFAKADAAMLTEADFDYAGFMRKFVYNPTVANNSFKNHTAAEKAAVGDFISNNRQSPHAVSWYLDSANRPAAVGMGVGVMLNFMMKVRPAEFATYSSMLDKMLVFTGVAKEPSPKEITVESYEANKALQGLVLAKMHELGIGKAADDGSAADYLTVNEFAWWLSDEKNQNLVKEEMMSKQMKKPNDSCVEDSTKSIVDELKDKADTMMARLTASLLTKPFVILAGASGTGKSRMVKKLAYMTCRADMLRNPHDETPGNYCMIAVKPNWHDSSELLGYKSAFAGHEYVSSDFVKFILKAFAFPNTPFFVCLDEMNLAPVEQYFAEYLSAVESVGKNKADEWVGDPLIQRGEFGGDVLNLAPEYELPGTVRTAINEKGLFIPKNLFVVGTVNMDDTTNQFSRKVLDRAMTIMMNEVDFGTLKDGAYEKLTNALRIKNDEIEKFIDRPSFVGSMLDEDFEELLNGIKAALADSPFEIGYRFAIETALYREALAFLTGKTTSEGDGESAKAERNELSQIAVDHLTLMKVLPRMTGTLSERDAVLKDLKTFLGSLGAHHQLSAAMLERMTKFAENNGGYISFWP